MQKEIRPEATGLISAEVRNFFSGFANVIMFGS